MNTQLEDELSVASYSTNVQLLSDLLSRLQQEAERAETAMRDKLLIKATYKSATNNASSSGSSSIPISPSPDPDPSSIVQLCELCERETAVYVCWNCSRYAQRRFYCFECHSEFHKPKKYMHHRYAGLVRHLTIRNGDDGRAPWQIVPEAVWGLILQWIPAHQDIVNVACLSRSSLAHPAIRQWNWNKPLTLRELARLAHHRSLPDHNPFRRKRSAEAEAADALANMAVNDVTTPSKRVNLQIGSEGSTRRVFIGIEEAQWAANEEVALLPDIGRLAPHAHELTYCLTHPIPLGLGPLPKSLRVLTLKLGNHEYGNLLPSNCKITRPLGQLLLQLPSTLTELNLLDVNRRPDVTLPLFGLTLPKSLIKLQLPTMRFPLTQMEFPLGLTTLHMGGAYVSDRNDLTDSLEMNQSIALEWPKLPTSLKHLTTGSPAKSQDFLILAIKIIRGVNLPQGLETLDMMGISLSVNELNGLLPASLKRLKLDGFLELQQLHPPSSSSSPFYDNSNNWVLPPNLQELELILRQANTEKWFNNVPKTPHLPTHFTPIFHPHLMQLPSTLHSIVGFPPIDPSDVPLVRFPNSLKTLRFGEYFNCPLEQLRLPSQLEELHLGDHFNFTLSGTHFPPSLSVLNLGNRFNGSLVQWHWHPPASLTELHVGSSWLGILSELYLPDTLRRLTLRGFRAPLTSDYIWPSQLEYLEFGAHFYVNEPFKDWNPPPRLLHIRARSSFRNLNFDAQKWPPLLQQFDFESGCFTPSRLQLHNWPPYLSEWYIDLPMEIRRWEKKRDPFAWYHEVVVEGIPASVRKLSIFLPVLHSVDEHKKFWAELEKFVSYLPDTLHEIRWICLVNSRETLDFFKGALRRACACLPTNMKVKVIGQIPIGAPIPGRPQPRAVIQL